MTMSLTPMLTRLFAAALVIVALATTPALASAGSPPSGVYAAPSPQAHVQSPTPGPLWSYEYEAGDPNAARDSKAALTPSTDDGTTPWLAIAAGLGGACLLLGGGAAMTGRIRPRVST
jgi:hypothetical protein